MHSFSTKLCAVWLLLLLPVAIAEHSDVILNQHDQEWQEECESYQLAEHTRGGGTLSIGEISEMLQEKLREISGELRTDWQMDQIDEQETELLMPKMLHLFSEAPDFDLGCGDSAQLEGPSCEAE